MVRVPVIVLFATIAACGDDGATPGDGTGTTSSTGGDDPVVVDDSDGSGATGSSGDVVDDTSGSGSEASSGSGSDGGSSTTGEPNAAPIAVDDAYLVLFGTGSLAVAAAEGVLANDSDPDGDAIAIDAFDAVSVAGRTVDIADDGSLVYTPGPIFWGEDELTYTISDGNGGTATARVRVVVAPTAMPLNLVGGGLNGYAIEGELAGDEIGRAVGIAGDVDGDGYDDVLVGAPNAASGDGRVYVVFGSDAHDIVALSDIASGLGGFVIEGSIGEAAGTSIDGAGDVNGDGLADIVIGAPAADAGSGRAYVVFGKADGDPVALADVAMGTGGLAILATTPAGAVGESVAGAGDVDGDGRGDVVIGAPSGGASGEGEAYVVFGTDATTPIGLGMIGPAGQGFRMLGAVAGDVAGSAVAGLHDVDGDGLADVGIGAPEANPNGGNSGAVYVVFGKTDGNDVALGSLGAGGFPINGAEGIDQAGSSVDGVGDADGDGLSDIVVGAPGAEAGLAFQGRAYVVFGKATSTTVELATVATGIGGFALDGQAEGDFAGTSVAGLGDVDADGRADLALGVVNADFGGSISGRTYVVWGKSDGAVVPLASAADGSAGYALDGEGAGHESGWQVAGGGDIDGDGHHDLVIGAPSATPAGRVYVTFGGDYRGNVTHFGSPGADALVGTNAPDVIVAGDGDDVLQSASGADVIYAARGDDACELPTAQFFRIDGGGGTDTLRITGADVTIDLVTAALPAVRNVEVVDLTGSGANTLVLGHFDLLAMVGPAHALLVLGDADDEVQADLTAGAWAAVGVMDGVMWWTDGVSQLGVAQAVTADVTLP